MTQKMFAVGDRVYLSNNTNTWTWTIEMRENYDKTEQVVSFVDSDNTFRVEASPLWWFHFSNATLIERGPNEPVAEVEDDEDDSDDYVTTNDGDSILREDAFETELDGWVHRDNLLRAQDGTTMHEDNYSDHDYAYDRHGDLYHMDDLVYVDNAGEYYHTSEEGDYFYYHQNAGEYYTYPPSHGRHGYHEGPRNDFSGDAKFRFGVEVEKEDEAPIDNHDLDDVDSMGWSREEDGSLDSDSGFELVSPTYDLFGDRFDDDLGIEILADHINADVSTNCGGHMGFSVQGLSGSEVFDRYNGFFPLLLAMYRHRLKGTWSKIRGNKALKRGRDKYSAVNVRYDYIEFRVFSAVPSVKTLLWRRDLMRIMAKNPKKGVMWWIGQAMNENTATHQHLRKVYSTDKIRLVCAYAAAIAERMNGRDYGQYVHFMDESEVSQAKQFVGNL